MDAEIINVDYFDPVIYLSRKALGKYVTDVLNFNVIKAI